MGAPAIPAGWLTEQQAPDQNNLPKPVIGRRAQVHPATRWLLSQRKQEKTGDERPELEVLRTGGGGWRKWLAARRVEA